jgi:integrase
MRIWALRGNLQTAHQARKLALFNLYIDSKLRGCDLVSPRVRNVARGGQMLHRTRVMQHKAQRAVQFEVPEPTRDVLAAGIAQAALKSDGYLFPSRLHGSLRVWLVRCQ